VIVWKYLETQVTVTVDGLPGITSVKKRKKKKKKRGRDQLHHHEASPAEGSRAWQKHYYIGTHNHLPFIEHQQPSSLDGISFHLLLSSIPFNLLAALRLFRSSQSQQSNQ
jgi:hypothetical protein